MLGLPEGIRGCLFDMDGVLTRTATVHARAWKTMFDDFLRAWAEKHGTEFVPFDAVADYDRYVDGKKRLDGARSFLQSRGIGLPEGTLNDPPGTMTVYGLSNRKNALVQAIIDKEGVDVFPGSVRYLAAVRDAGLRRAVVSSSANTEQVLAAAGLATQFEARIDGVVARERHLAGKPAPDMYLAGAEALGLEAAEAVVFEDALAGVAAGRAGGFGFVVGVDRTGQADALRDHGADVVVNDLADLLGRGRPSRRAG
ncbi:beta-phosphoglucomutase family hydrolase [Nonomuraea spiralis]|uniref:beta-phosphoglucomutase family hydrolase n=1 Tax=Nonomuraea spiralis TaxID=46182 RepID=UPI0037A32539